MSDIMELVIRAAYYRGLESAEMSGRDEEEAESAISDLLAKARRYVDAQQDLANATKSLEEEVVR